MEGMGRGMSNICGEHMTYMLYTRNLENNTACKNIISRAKSELSYVDQPY